MSASSGFFSKELMIGLGFSFIFVPIISFSLRIWAKRLGRIGITSDDWFLFGGLIVAVATNCCQLIGAYDGELGQHEINGPDGLPLPGDERFAVYEKTKFAVNCIYYVGLGMIKVSILILYMRIFPSRTFQTISRVMIGCVVAWAIAFFFSNLFICTPVTPFIEPFYSNHCYNGVPMWWTACVTDVVMDLVILVMPVRPVLELQLPLKQRLGVLSMFFLGATVCAISVTRLAVYIDSGLTYLKYASDETYYTSPTFFWTTIELSTAVVSACLPTYRPLFIKAKQSRTLNSLSARQSYRLESLRSEKDSHVTHSASDVPPKTTPHGQRKALPEEAITKEDQSELGSYTEIVSGQSVTPVDSTKDPIGRFDIRVERTFHTDAADYASSRSN